MQRNITPYYTYYITLHPPCKATFGTIVRQFWKKRRAGIGRFHYPAGAQKWIYAIPVGACRTSMNSNVHTSATYGLDSQNGLSRAPTPTDDANITAKSRAFPLRGRWYPQGYRMRCFVRFWFTRREEQAPPLPR